MGSDPFPLIEPRHSTTAPLRGWVLRPCLVHQGNACETQPRPRIRGMEPRPPTASHLSTPPAEIGAKLVTASRSQLISDPHPHCPSPPTALPGSVLRAALRSRIGTLKIRAIGPSDLGGGHRPQHLGASLHPKLGHYVLEEGSGQPQQKAARLASPAQPHPAPQRPGSTSSSSSLIYEIFSICSFTSPRAH